MSSSQRTSVDSPLLAIVGAGPKAAALVAKAAVLRKLNLPSVRTVVIEAEEPAANWNGLHGFTHGHCELGTPPQKDVGYPYRSPQGPDVDHEMLKYSWEAFLISSGSYSEWIDQGRPQPRHSTWGNYLSWVFAQAAAEIQIGKVTEISPTT